MNLVNASSLCISNNNSYVGKMWVYPISVSPESDHEERQGGRYRVLQNRTGAIIDIIVSGLCNNIL